MEKAHFPVIILCRVMQVSRSGFCDWCRREKGIDPERLRLIERLRAIHARTRGS
ncbi:MAG: hypothetical protein J5I81_13315 [Nitrococcus mobilis]|nr:hypothetical protein [Nitrococcus mobilis]